MQGIAPPAPKERVHSDVRCIVTRKVPRGDSPILVCMSACAVVSGTGIVMTTLSAKSLLLKPAFTFVFTSIRVLPSSVIRGVTCTC